MRFLLALVALTLTQAQKGPAGGKGKAPMAHANSTNATHAPMNATMGPVDLAKMDAGTEKASIIALQVQSSLDNEEDANGGSAKGTIVDLVLQSLNENFTAVCNSTSADFTTCAQGYVSLDCVFQQSAASFGGVNCIPYLSQCADQMLTYCQQTVPANQKCVSQTPCDCANEAGCGWSIGRKMCLINRDQVSCGDCPTMTRCGTIDCLIATRPCDCRALGGLCGWSTSNWRCESGKDTDCNECAEQTECGGPGVIMDHQQGCPSALPTQLSACTTVTTCSFNKQCCPRCAGQKQVCAETQAECDGETWEIRTSPLVCPDCQDYYYDEYATDAPSEPMNITATGITQTSVVLNWKAPQKNFKVGVDEYSVAYAVDGTNDTVKILDTSAATHTSITGLTANTGYKVSILPVVNATQAVGAAGTLDFKTLAAAGGPKAKGAKGAKGKVAPGKVAAKAPKAGRR